MTNADLKRIAGNGFLYLATPYTNYPDGHQAAFDIACLIAADLMASGVNVLSPIAHSHPIAMQGIDNVDHEFWMNVDRPFMDAARGLIVAKIPGWQVSRGVTEEIAHFVKSGKPIVYLDWERE